MSDKMFKKTEKKNKISDVTAGGGKEKKNVFFTRRRKEALLWVKEG